MIVFVRDVCVEGCGYYRYVWACAYCNRGWFFVVVVAYFNLEVLFLSGLFFLNLKCTIFM